MNGNTIPDKPKADNMFRVRGWEARLILRLRQLENQGLPPPTVILDLEKRTLDVSGKIELLQKS